MNKSIRKPALFAVVLLTHVSAMGQQDPVGEVVETRKKIEPVVAEYRETVHVVTPIPDKPGTISWGNKDSTEVVTCGVSADSVFLTRTPQNPEMPLADGGINTVIRREGKTFNVIESGGRGLILTHVMESTFPIAEGFMVDGLDIREYAKLWNLLADSASGLRLTSQDGSHVVTLCRRKDQTLVEQVFERSQKYLITAKTLEWVELAGKSFPKVHFIEVRTSDGRLDRTFRYEFIKFVKPDGAPFVATWKEGATVKDGDSGIVYMMKNGKLVPDPDFMKKTAEETTQRRLLFLGCFVIAGGGISYWILKRRRLKTGVASGA